MVQIFEAMKGTWGQAVVQLVVVKQGIWGGGRRRWCSWLWECKELGGRRWCRLLWQCKELGAGGGAGGRGNARNWWAGGGAGCCGNVRNWGQAVVQLVVAMQGIGVRR